MLLQIIFGVLFIIAGIIMGLMAMFGAGMASRQTTRFENTWRPLLWFTIPTSIGIVLLVFQ